MISLKKICMFVMMAVMSLAFIASNSMVEAGEVKQASGSSTRQKVEHVMDSASKLVHKMKS